MTGSVTAFAARLLAWFDAHRGEYEEFYVAPAKAFVAALATRLPAPPGEEDPEAAS